MTAFCVNVWGMPLDQYRQLCEAMAVHAGPLGEESGKPRPRYLGVDGFKSAWAGDMPRGLIIPLDEALRRLKTAPRSPYGLPNLMVLATELECHITFQPDGQVTFLTHNPKLALRGATDKDVAEIVAAIRIVGRFGVID